MFNFIIIWYMLLGLNPQYYSRKEQGFCLEYFLEPEEMWGKDFFFLGHVSNVLKDVLIEDILVDSYCSSVILFFLFPTRELTCVEVLNAVKTCSASCVVGMMGKYQLILYYVCRREKRPVFLQKYPISIRTCLAGCVRCFI